MTLPRLPMSKALRDLVATVTAKPCGLGAFPTSPTGVALEPPYTVLYELGGSGYSGPVYGDDHADASWTYQMTFVARRPDQATWLADRARGAFFARRGDDTDWLYPLEVPGMVVMGRGFDSDSGVQTENGLVNLAERFTIRVTPATDLLDRDLPTPRTTLPVWPGP